MTANNPETHNIISPLAVFLQLLIIFYAVIDWEMAKKRQYSQVLVITQQPNHQDLGVLTPLHHRNTDSTTNHHHYIHVHVCMLHLH